MNWKLTDMKKVRLEEEDWRVSTSGVLCSIDDEFR